MSIYYSKKTKGFYDTRIHGANIPEDSVEITAEEHIALLSLQSSGKIILADADGKPIAVDIVYSAEELREIVFDRIDSLRDAKVKAGVPYTFPDSISGTIQTRDEKDFRNITGIATMGIITAGQAITFPFRDQEDVSHSLTPEQAVALGVAVTNRVSEIYTAAWAHKEALSALTTAEEIEAYDITVNWP